MATGLTGDLPFIGTGLIGDFPFTGTGALAFISASYYLASSAAF